MFLGSKFHNILSKFRWTYRLIYFGLPYELKWIRCTLSILQGSFGYSSVHKGYSKFRVWLFENNKFPQDSVFHTAIRLNEAYIANASFATSGRTFICCPEYYFFFYFFFFFQSNFAFLISQGTISHILWDKGASAFCSKVHCPVSSPFQSLIISQIIWFL